MLKKIILLFCLLFCLPINATVYYLRSDGSDSNSGTSDTAGGAWRNISKATSTVVAGDTVYFETDNITTWAADTLTESTSGSSGNYINYVGRGARIFRAVLTGSRIRLIGFEITHSSGTSTGMTLGGDFLEILNNNIHNTGSYNIDPSGSDDLIIRNNIMNYPGSPGNDSGSGQKAIADNADCFRVLIEYNWMSHNTDFTCPRGQYWMVRNNRLGPSSTDDFGGTPHVDGWQSNAAMRDGWMYRNWHVDNSVSDSHMILIEAPVSGRNRAITVFKNVSLRSGDQLWYQMRDGTNLHNFNNTVGQIGYGPRGGPGSSGFIYAWSDANGPSTENVSKNNVYWEVTTSGGAVYTVNSGSEIDRGYDMVAPLASDFTTGVNGMLEFSARSSLGFVDYDNNDVRLTSGSPGVDSGTAVTTVTSSSDSGTSFVVENSLPFHDGFGLCEGLLIYVGGDNNLLVTDVDYSTHTITVSSSFTWSSGDSVGYAYRGSGPDRGAYEYGDTLLSAATYTVAGTTYTCTTTGDAEMVIFYQDGTPHTVDTDSPFTATITSGTVTVEAYALHPQETTVFTASLAAGSSNPRTISNSHRIIHHQKKK